MNYIKLDDSISRKPRILGDLLINQTSQHKDFLRKSTKHNSLGCVYSERIEKDDPILLDLQKACELHGFVVNSISCDSYLVCDYTFGAGSVVLHKDPGLGLTVNVLVALQSFSRSFDCYNDCQLIAQGKSINLKVGSVFVFNGNFNHAWIANCRWLIATQSVKLRRNC
jgi:hypothetical protein